MPGEEPQVTEAEEPEMPKCNVCGEESGDLDEDGHCPDCR